MKSSYRDKKISILDINNNNCEFNLFENLIKKLKRNSNFKKSNVLDDLGYIKNISKNYLFILKDICDLIIKERYIRFYVLFIIRLKFRKRHKNFFILYILFYKEIHLS